MPADDLTTVPAQLAQIHEQIKGLASAMDEIKTSVREVATLDKTIAQLAIKHEQVDAQIVRNSNVIESCVQSLVKLDSESVERTALVNSKADEWINKARGAWWTAMLLGGFMQVVILSMIAWTFGHIRSAEDDVMLIKYRVELLEQKANQK